MIAFILNPAAGHGGAGNFWRRFEPLLQGRLGPYRVSLTRARGHAAELVREAVSGGATRIVAVGGDGTLNEVADGLLRIPEADRKGAAVACLPAGSGCDFARHFGLPRDGPWMAELLASGEPRRIDAGWCRFEGLDGRPRESHFVNIAAFGLAGDVVFSMERLGKPLGGTFSYLAASITALLRSRPRSLRIRLDAKTLEGGYHMVAVANTSTTGGGMRIAPGADASDGRLDVVSVGPLGRATLLRNFPKIYAGTHLGVEGVEATQAWEVEAAPALPEEKVLLNLDGEASGRLPALFRVLPGALPVILPRASGRTGSPSGGTTASPR